MGMGLRGCGSGYGNRRDRVFAEGTGFLLSEQNYALRPRIQRTMQSPRRGPCDHRAGGMKSVLLLLGGFGGCFLLYLGLQVPDMNQWQGAELGVAMWILNIGALVLLVAAPDSGDQTFKHRRGAIQRSQCRRAASLGHRPNGVTLVPCPGFVAILLRGICPVLLLTGRAGLYWLLPTRPLKRFPPSLSGRWQGLLMWAGDALRFLGFLAVGALPSAGIASWLVPVLRHGHCFGVSRICFSPTAQRDRSLAKLPFGECWRPCEGTGRCAG